MSPEAFRARMARSGFFAKWKGKLASSLKKRGIVGTVKYAPVLPIRGLYDLWVPYADRAFDRRFGVETATNVELPELRSDPRFRHSHSYGPTTRSIFFRMVRQLNLDYGRFVFIDFGCGKGKAVLLASELPFKQIIGVELSSKLIQVAEDNLKSYRRKPHKCNTIQLVCMDAADYPIPHEPAVYYFANPFGAEVMRKVVDNIRTSLAEAPRETYIVYLSAIYRKVLDDSGFLTPIKHRHLYSIYKSTAV